MGRVDCLSEHHTTGTYLANQALSTELPPIISDITVGITSLRASGLWKIDSPAKMKQPRDSLRMDITVACCPPAISRTPSPPKTSKSDHNECIQGAADELQQIIK